MKKNTFILWIIAICGSAFLTSCATSSGLSEAAKNNVPTKLWYDNATLLVEANNPELKADSFIGVPALDAVVDTVKDLLVQVPNWAVTKIEQSHFENAYMESAKALHSGMEGADLVIKGEAFKTALLMDTFAQEIQHANAAVGVSPEEKKAIYAQNEQVYEDAVAKVSTYAENEIFAFQSCLDDASRQAFFADATRAQWDARSTEIAQKIKECIENSDDEEAARAGMAKLSREMGVQEIDWMQVAILLQNDLMKLQKAAQDFAQVIQNDSDLQTRIAKAAFGGEIVPGVSGKETLAVINRFKNQVAVTIKLTGWLISSLGH